MDKKNFIESVKTLRKNYKKRNFVQSIDLIIALKNVNLKKPSDRISLIVKFPHGRGKAPKICALVDKMHIVEARKVFDKAIMVDGFSKLKPKEAKKIVKTYDLFVAQANIMSQVATTFGKFLGPRGKMPDPKLGCVIPPQADLNKIKQNLMQSVKITVKKAPVLQVLIGIETMEDTQIVDNAFSIYDAVKKALPQSEHQIRKVYIKTTMGKPIKVGKHEESNKKET